MACPSTPKGLLWFTNLSTAFASLAVEGCVSKETYTVMDNHIKLMQAEIAEIKQRKKAMLERHGALIEQGLSTQMGLMVLLIWV